LEASCQRASERPSWPPSPWLATATPPDGWEERLITFEPPGAQPGRGLCLEPHDLAASKLAAGRIKDFEFVDALLRAGLIEQTTLIDRVDRLPRARGPAAKFARAGGWVRDWN